METGSLCIGTGLLLNEEKKVWFQMIIVHN